MKNFLDFNKSNNPETLNIPRELKYRYDGLTFTAYKTLIQYIKYLEANDYFLPLRFDGECFHLIGTEEIISDIEILDRLEKYIYQLIFIFTKAKGNYIFYPKYEPTNIDLFNLKSFCEFLLNSNNFYVKNFKPLGSLNFIFFIIACITLNIRNPKNLAMIIDLFENKNL